jgi:hypothetical protein
MHEDKQRFIRNCHQTAEALKQLAADAELGRHDESPHHFRLYAEGIRDLTALFRRVLPELNYPASACGD